MVVFDHFGPFWSSTLSGSTAATSYKLRFGIAILNGFSALLLYCDSALFPSCSITVAEFLAIPGPQFFFSGNRAIRDSRFCAAEVRIRNPSFLGCVTVFVAPHWRDTARLSQPYPPIVRYGVFGVSTWPIGCDAPSPFSERFPLESMRSGGAMPPPTQGVSQRYFRDTL